MLIIYFVESNALHTISGNIVVLDLVVPYVITGYS